MTVIISYPKRKYSLKRQNDPYKRRSLKNKGKRKVGSLSRLQKNLDAIFSRFIRLRAADKDGNVACFTCYHIYPYKKLHNGHYVLRGYKSVRWNEDNCRPQCGVCNLWRKGEPVTFRENLVKELGEEKVKEIELKRHELFKVTAEWLQEKINLYTEKVKLLEEKVR